ncbi:class I SAM-dependent methyltransferase [Candidatus Microgenomates bacterium]|nr:class I SAM-dependent methyltransferase [Candidatus Microgenomates bacterium]
MKKTTNLPKQTKEWEMACVKTRRNLGKREERLSVFKIGKKQKVLDLGCGDGLNTSILVKKGVKNIVGVDISSKLVKNAKSINPKIKFYKASAEKLPFKDNSFDVVLVDSVFHHLMGYSKSLLEIKRVLKPKGRLCFIEPHNSLVRNIYDKLCEWSIGKYIPLLKNRRDSYLKEIDFMKHWLRTEKSFFKKLVNLGFKEKMKKLDMLSVIGIYEVK